MRLESWWECGAVSEWCIEGVGSQDDMVGAKESLWLTKESR